MNKQNYLLTCLAEECAEVVQRVTKTLRFGLEEVQPEQKLNNKERLTHELTDIVAIIELLREEGVAMPVYDSMKVQAKKDRVKKFMVLSVEQGCLEE